MFGAFFHLLLLPFWRIKMYIAYTVICTLAVDGWAVTFVQRGGAWAGCGPAQSPPHCTKCNSPPINGQYINFIHSTFDVAL